MRPRRGARRSERTRTKRAGLRPWSPAERQGEAGVWRLGRETLPRRPRHTSGARGPTMIDNRDVGTSDLHEEERESRYEAAPAVVVVIALQVVLALVSIKGDRRLIGL